MQHVAATVRLAGDLNFTVRKPNLTVPEVVLLRLLHGPDAVVEIRPIGTSKRTLRAERERLMGQYGLKPLAVKTIDGMFANVAIQPLETLADIGIDPSTPTEPKVKPTARVLVQGDFKPYDAADDIMPGEEPEEEITAPASAAAQDEIADDFEATAEPEPDAEAIMAEGRAAARKGARR